MKAKHKVIIALVSFAVCSAIFSVALVYPVFRGVLGDYNKVLAHKREILQFKEDVNSSREFGMLSAQYAREFTQLEELFVDSNIPIAFFRFLDETAVSLNVQIEKSPGAAQQIKEDRWPSFEVRVAGNAAYPRLMAFLQKIESSPYLLEARALSISSKQGLGGEVGFSLLLKVFTKPL